MKVLIKSTAGNDYSRDDYNTTLKQIRGQWVEVDTKYLFKNQYNLSDYAIRVYDKDIEAVQDDARKGLVKCGYCGAQFHGLEELQAHYAAEEESAHKCESCKDYVRGIVDIQHSKDAYIDENGNEVQTRTAKYIYGKKCRWDGGCNKFEHRNHKPEFFTAENTYFLKYPNGYAEYFKSLPTNKKWDELGMKWSCEEGAAEFVKPDTGTYRVRLARSPYGWELFAANARTRYYMPADLLAYCLSNCYNIDYCATFGPIPNDCTPGKYADKWKALPKAAQKAVKAAVEYLRDRLRAEYVKDFVFAKEK